MFTPNLNPANKNPYATPTEAGTVTYDPKKPLGPTNLLEGQRTVDPGAINLINEQAGLNFENPNKDREFIDKDLGSEKSFLPTQNKLSSGGINSSIQTPGLSEALSQRAARSYEDKMSALKNLSDIESPYQRFARLNQLADSYNKINQIQINNYKEQMQYVLQQRQAYNDWARAKEQASTSMLGSILGGIGTLGGAVIGGLVGGPLGAMAGSSAGGSVGSSLSKI